jgi:hypothetical protein
MLGVLISCHQPTQDAPPVPPHPHELDWEQLADKAVDNANLELTELLPSPPMVIIIDDDDNNYQVPVIPSTSQLQVLPKVEPTSNPLPTPHKPTLEPLQYPAQTQCTPQHLQDYVFTMVAEEHNQPPGRPYQTAGDTVVNHTITDEYMMAQVRHFVMKHTVDSLYCAESIKPKRNSIVLKLAIKHLLIVAVRPLLRNLPNLTL